MIGIAMLLAWMGYSAGFWGYSLIKGYNLGIKQIVSPVGYYTGSWPPPQAGNTAIVPDGSQASLVTVGFTSSTTTSTSGSSGSSGGGSGPSAGPAPSGNNWQAIQAAAKVFGWSSGTQWACLQWVVNAESGANPHIKNGSSGAYGIAQALGHGTPGSAGTESANYGANYGLSTAQAKAANSGNAYYQAFWMCGYIKARYGTPCAAKQFHLANNYY